MENTNNVENLQQPLPKFEDATPKAQITNNTNTSSYFDGKILDLLALKMLEATITALSLGIARPWILCFVNKYKYNHTVLNGRRLKFEGKGEDLFFLMFRWYFFTIITCGIYALVIPANEARWIAEHLHFEDEALTEGNSYFTGDTLAFIEVNLLCTILTSISFGLLLPFSICYKLKWICNHTVINNKKIVFKGKSISLFGKIIVWSLLSLITFGIYSLWFDLNLIKWKVQNIILLENETVSTNIPQAKKSSKAPIIIVAVIGVIIAIIVGIALISMIFANSKNLSSINPFSKNTNVVESNAALSEKYCKSGWKYNDDNDYCYTNMSYDQCYSEGYAYYDSWCISPVLYRGETIQDLWRRLNE